MQKYEKRIDTVKAQYNLKRRRLTERCIQMMVCEQFIFLHMQIIFCIKLKLKFKLGIGI